MVDKKMKIFTKTIFLILVLGIVVFFIGAYSSFKEINVQSKSASFVDIVNVANKEKDKEQARVFIKLFKQVRDEWILAKTSFLEINLDEMKVRIYENGEIKKQVPILTKGNPKEWGGTAVGIYSAKSKYVTGFSVPAEAYMPWSIHFYGKYYLHGEPYYSGGEPLISSVSGGCIRLKNLDGKSIYESVEINMPVLVIDKMGDNYEYVEANPKEPINISAKSYLAADLDSGFILAQKNSKKQLPIASLTKLMTALVVSENINLERAVTVKEEMLEAYGSTQGLEKDLQFRPVELFYPLLIESSNDVAEVLTGFLGREKTLQLMNEKAKAILMKDTEFTGPSGYDPGNVSTTQDLFYLARYILNNRPPMLKITKGEIVTSYGPIDFDIENLWNKNVFISDPTFVGGKTGFIKSSKYTAIFIFNLIPKQDVLENDSVEKNISTKNIERNIAIILLGSDNEELDAQKIYSWLVKNYFEQ
ncbi:MAG: L,D-transpeptidase family protein [Candidatus Pacebacteria bacterium]|nr:L,D-transpeptidase family protein [Candidatus Paceibacterota bacterium]